MKTCQWQVQMSSTCACWEEDATVWSLCSKVFVCLKFCAMYNEKQSVWKKRGLWKWCVLLPPPWACSNDYGYYDVNICKHDVTRVLVFIVHRHNLWFCELCPPFFFFSCKGYALLFIPCRSYSWCPADVCFVSFEILFEVSTVAVGHWWVENCKKLNSWVIHGVKGFSK